MGCRQAAEEPQREEEGSDAVSILEIDLFDLDNDHDFSLVPGLFPRAVRGHVRAFGAFVRTVDEIADDPRISTQEKLARLDVFDAALDGYGWIGWSERDSAAAAAMHASVTEGAPADHARSIVRAFRRDVAGARYQSWNDVLTYCEQAAGPVGRHLLDLLHEDTVALGPQSDTLCAALRILKRLRKSRDETLKFNRLCIPEQFLEDAMVSVRQLRAPSAKGQTRAVIDRVLDGVDRMLHRAQDLPDQAATGSIQRHTSIMMCRALKLAERFREVDPLQQRVALNRGERRACTWRSIARSLMNSR